ncbi:MAG: hypothetical protein K5871_03700 [Lachnospiraceae bacterium]|nr:hypothetical protein [Lachnospiraceae bacterium]
MKEISFGKYGTMSAALFAAWMVAAVLVILGGVLMILEGFGVIAVKTWVQLLPITAGTTINSICLIVNSVKNRR